MKFFRFYLLICIVFLSFNSVVLAQSSGEDFEGQVKDIIADQRTSYYYTLGSLGYSGDSFSVSGYSLSTSGFAIAIIGGWQQSRFFAMELGVGYSQTWTSKADLKYALLFQPIIKLNNSWSILPKVGIGAHFSSNFISYYDQFNLGLYGTAGVKMSYGKIMFGLSYEHTAISFDGNEFRILAEGGIKF